MHFPVTEESRLSDYLKHAGPQFHDEKDVIFSLYNELSAVKNIVSNKDIIVSLLKKLEKESDIVKLDIYRKALEIVVQRTPDDVIY
ncbi:biofilm development regulator YmgB/AriR family protein [Pantoea sp.]|uniref:biofilm development regulator YmgB/AriR family protein n=1 Tax=Pantoea sp. TaxID=69393 RepID=UPI002899C1D2|nr:biofilm development regulator YmgB/AriR family protein [Pantoea sp.]